jgi:hypothetical protein
VKLPALPDHVRRALERKSGVIADLAAGSLRCAEFIEPYARCRLIAPEHPLGQLAPKVAEAAFEGLAESCALAREERLSDSNGHDLSVEGLALLRWLTLDPGAALQMRPQSRELPAKAISAVLGEVERARTAEQTARVDVPALGTAVLLLGAATLSMLVVALLAATNMLDVTVTARDRIVGAVAFVSSVVVLSVFRWLVLGASRRQHPERRDLAFAQVVLFVVVLLAFVAGVWKIASTDWKPNVVVLAAAVGVVGLILLVLRRFRLAPIWAVEVAAIFSDPKGLLTYVVAKDSKEKAES